MSVPNKGPTNWGNRRIAIIGEAPGVDEVRLGQPFVGASGMHLDKLLDIAQCPNRAYCYMGNVSMERPHDNKIELFKWDGPEITTGLCQLTKDMLYWRPNIVVLLGNVPLKAARDPNRIHPLKNNTYRYKVSTWRGTLFKCDEPLSPFFGLKCIATFHPAYCLRDYKVNPLARFDLLRVREECEFPELHLPEEKVTVLTTPDEVEFYCGDMRSRRNPVALDIEGGLGTMSCISFSWSHESAIVIPFYTKKGFYVWDDSEGPRVWKALVDVLEDPAVPKILQNSLYDMFVLKYGYGILVRGLIDDTMLSSWEIYSQLRKSLGVQASIWTRRPYWKHERLQREEDEDE